MLQRVPPEFAEEICLLWVDIQGYEGFMFQGAENTLSRGIPVVSEIWPYGIAKAGMTSDEFCGIARRFWSAYAVWRDEEFVEYPIEMFGRFLDELGYEGKFDNVIFLP